MGETEAFIGGDTADVTKHPVLIYCPDTSVCLFL